MPYFYPNPSIYFQLPFDPHYPVVRTLFAPRLATPLGNGAVQLRRRYARLLSQFTLRDMQADKTRADELFGYLHLFQGDTPFFWHGGEWGTVSHAFVGYNDGNQTQIFLPHRFIIGNLLVYSPTAQTLLVPQPSLDGASGLLTYAAPFVGAVWASYTTLYKVTFWSQDQETLWSESNIAQALYSQEGLILRECVP